MRIAVTIPKVYKLAALTRKMLRYPSPNKRLVRIGVLIVVFTLLATAYPAEEGAHVHGQESITTGGENEQVTNAICPVMPDMKAEPDIFTDYEGKRIYFCCRNCKAAFGKNPKKYLSRLPQFGGSEAHAGHEGPGYELTLTGFIKPVGITTLSLLVLTVAAALLRRRKPKLLLKWHKRLGITTLVFAAIHVILVLIAH
jgi:YHS domain-containing protein